MKTWRASFKGLLNRNNTSDTALALRLIVLYVSLAIFSPIFQFLFFNITSTILLGFLSSILNAMGITSYAHKYMLTTSYNTVLLTWSNIPYIPLFATLALFLWLGGSWRARLCYALAGAITIKVLFMAGILLAVVQPAEQVEHNFAILNFVYFGIVLIVARHYTKRKLNPKN